MHLVHLPYAKQHDTAPNCGRATNRMKHTCLLAVFTSPLLFVFAMSPAPTAAPGRSLTEAEWALSGGQDDIPEVGWVCRAQNETCPTVNSGVPYGIFCGGGDGSTCTSCTNWQTREEACEITILSGCFISDIKVVCGEKFIGTCTTMDIGGGNKIKVCQPAGASVGTCKINLNQC